MKKKHISKHSQNVEEQAILYLCLPQGNTDGPMLKGGRSPTPALSSWPQGLGQQTTGCTPETQGLPSKPWREGPGQTAAGSCPHLSSVSSLSLLHLQPPRLDQCLSKPHNLVLRVKDQRDRNSLASLPGESAEANLESDCKRVLLLSHCVSEENKGREVRGSSDFLAQALPYSTHKLWLGRDGLLHSLNRPQVSLREICLHFGLTLGPKS